MSTWGSIRVISLCLLMVGLIGSASSNASSHAAEGEIRGTVTLRSEGALTPLAEALVRLAIYRADQQVAAAEASTNLRGEFRFLHLETDGNLTYVVQALYLGVPFPSSPQRFSSEKKRIDIAPLEVFATTGSSKGLGASETVLIRIGKADLVEFTHTLTVTNRGELFFEPKGEKGEPIEVQIPQGAFDLALHKGLSREFIEVDGPTQTLRIFRSIRPGQANQVEFKFSYSYLLDASEIEFKNRLSIARTAYNVLMVPSTPSLKSGELWPQPNYAIGEELAAVFSGGPFPARHEVQFTIHGIPMKKDRARKQLFLALAGILGLGFFYWWRRPRADTVLNAFEQLCQLETSMKNGKLTTDSFFAERERLRSLLFEERGSS